MGKILITATHYETLCQEAKQMLEGKGHELIINRTEKPFYTFEQLKEVMGEVDGAIIGLDDWTEEVFRISPKLRVVAKFGVGTDNIDKAAAKKYGIKVINAPGQNSNAVAELAVGLMVGVLRGILVQNKKLESGVWTRYMGNELEGKTIGLVGFGEIARRVAGKLAAFDVKILAYDLYPNKKAAEELGVKLTGLDEVLFESDIVSLHIPATEESRHVINARSIAKMKKGVFLINTARGALVDTDSLVAALKSGQVAGAALDAFEQEPLPENAGILRAGNVICLPHTGAETYEAYRKVSLCTAQGVIDVLDGKDPVHWLNP